MLRYHKINFNNFDKIYLKIKIVLIFQISQILILNERKKIENTNITYK